MADGVAAGRESAVRFGLLGPLQVVDAAGTAWPVRAAKQRIVLAALLLGAGTTVSAWELAEVLWDESPPPNAPAVLRTYVARLRRALGPAGARVVRRPGGWTLALNEPEELDLTRAEHLWQAARTADESQDWRRASVLLAEALSLWRGEPLIDVPSAVITRRDAGRLSELRLALTEARVDADLRLGRHAGLVAELRRLTAEHPLREHLAVQLMLACYRSGRQGAALEVYRDAHRTLTEKLGVTPGPELRDMQRRILAAEPGLAAGPRASGYQHGLPPDTAAFTGRGAELDLITAGRAAGAAGGGVVVINGMPGVGKTALAIHAAHQLAPAFPGRQMFIDLHGHTPGQDPVSPADALAELLSAAGVEARSLPADLASRSALWRGKMAGQRALLVLDNAASSAQAEPLLPASRGCLVLVTSRRHLADLPGLVVPVLVEVLPPAEAARMFTRLAPRAAAQDPGLVAELTGLAGFLPLAISLLARVYARHPAWGLADLISETRQRLLTLSAEHASVAAALEVSWQHLGPPQQEFLALLGLHPAATFDSWSAAALAQVSVKEAGGLLDGLHGEGLLTETGYRRYGMHDLLRGYARELSATQDTGEEQHAALTRLFDHYLHSAAAAMDTLFPAERGHRPRVAAADGLELPMMDPETARDWLGAEQASFASIVAHAAQHGWPGHAIRLAATIGRYLNTEGRYAQARTIHQHALRAAQQAGDATAETDALLWLGNACAQQDRLQEARTWWSRALARAQAIGYTRGQAGALNYLSFYADRTGQYRQAISSLEQARALHARTGDQIGVAYAVSNLGVIRLRQGDYQRAVDCQERALGLLRGCGDRYGATMALWRLGGALLRLGDCDHAGRTLRQALTQCQEFRDEQGEASIRADIGLVHLAQGEPQQAAGELHHALEGFREVGDVHSQAEALNGLGETSLAAGSFAEAREQHAAALQLATQTAGLREQARAHLGRGHASHGLGEPAEAIRHWQEALRIYAQLSAPEADQVRATIAAAGHEAGRKPPGTGKRNRSCRDGAVQPRTWNIPGRRAAGRG
jgi:DNA-binding SARP family transcriptional activator/tetratricopeptide (TPR) repeat protein